MQLFPFIVNKGKSDETYKTRNQNIKNKLNKLSKEVKIYLFGSLVNDSKKCGDIIC